ncbi:protein-L-isoaspartate(D-aspartate) O-methyltransferase [Pseudomonadota bacterium]
MTSSHRGIGMTSQRTRERLVSRLRDSGIKNSQVLDVILNTPRHIFIDEALASRAYDDTSLPIGFGQTISQPYIVARMTEILLETGPCDKVLEIGTGSGYQASVLAQLVEQVFSVERIGALQTKARKRMRDLKLYNVRMKHYDGHMGWKEHALYDAIIVTAAPNEIPQELLAQMAEGGRLICPVGPNGKQQLNLVTRTAKGYECAVIEEVSFVPLLTGSR